MRHTRDSGRSGFAEPNVGRLARYLAVRGRFPTSCSADNLKTVVADEDRTPMPALPISELHNGDHRGPKVFESEEVVLIAKVRSDKVVPIQHLRDTSVTSYAPSSPSQPSDQLVNQYLIEKSSEVIFHLGKKYRSTPASNRLFPASQA